MAAPVLPPFLHPDADSGRQIINVWCGLVAEFYSDPGDVKRMFVERLDWFKNNEGLKHEFLVLTIHQVDEPEAAVLRFERRPSREQLSREIFALVPDRDDNEKLNKETRKALEKDFEAEKQTLRSAALTKAQKKTDKKGDCVQASDTVTRVHSEKGQLTGCKESATLIESYSFDSILPLRDFIFAASTVSTYSERYLVFLQQCYWFSRTTVQVILQTYGPTSRRQGDAFSIRGKYTARGGFSLEVNTDNPSEVNNISTIFVDRLKENDALIEKKFWDGAGGKAAETKRADHETELRKKAEKDAENNAQKHAIIEEKFRRLQEEVQRLKRETPEARNKD
ncbi:unnamed protein product [Cyclocybe aegerita]|uniref:Uncharacterized protein n=1 Tax=Cyclocybe aegerita TaxID=1973307 RepID=A0A8S0VS33_CYCAE|nr:unnamed protein product [Cyclocybe aegerita]